MNNSLMPAMVSEDGFVMTRGSYLVNAIKHRLRLYSQSLRISFATSGPGRFAVSLNGQTVMMENIGIGYAATFHNIPKGTELEIMVARIDAGPPVTIYTHTTEVMSTAFDGETPWPWRSDERESGYQQAIAGQPKREQGDTEGPSGAARIAERARYRSVDPAGQE